MGFTNLILLQSAYSCSAHCPFFISVFPAPLTLSFFFLPLQLICCPRPPSPLSLWLSATPRRFFLPPSLCITLFSLMGSLVNMSLSLDLLFTISSLIAVKLMKWSTTMTHSFRCSLPCLQSFMPPPFFLSIFLLVSLLFLLLDFESLFLMVHFSEYFTPLLAVFDSSFFCARKYISSLFNSTDISQNPF